MFSEPLHVGRPNIGDRDELMRRIGMILDRRWLTNDGVCVRELESAVSAITGTKHCVAMCNATVALEIMIRACGLTGEVLVPSYTFVATAHALQWQAITPVFCDIDSRTHTLDPDCLARQITPRTTGIIGVHVWGQPCDVAGLQRVANDHSLTLLYDAAHAFGVTHQGQSLAKYGKASVLSFHATKFVNSFEGGAVVTDDDELAEKMRLMRNFGFAGEDRVVYVGTNGKMCEVSAAMGITSIEAMSEFIATNRDNYHAYREGLAGLPGIRLIQYDFAEEQNYQYVVLDIDCDEAGLTRDELKQILTENNVLARRYFWPGCHRMEPYKSLYPNCHLWLPETERVADRVLVLPTGTAVTAEDVTEICHLVRRQIDLNCVRGFSAANPAIRNHVDQQL
ncbi:MAG: DegT/DnrJ/EryC1/StrS family aminotransferase [Planctomycetes bacterium]|nr:DegT/DnrJ/EryC1/StrS family aminotransferase [Planctomycetota bacterium]